MPAYMPTEICATSLHEGFFIGWKGYGARLFVSQFTLPDEGRRTFWILISQEPLIIPFSLKWLMHSLCALGKLEREQIILSRKLAKTQSLAFFEVLFIGCKFNLNPPTGANPTDFHSCWLAAEQRVKSQRRCNKKVPRRPFLPSRKPMGF